MADSARDLARTLVMPLIGYGHALRESFTPRELADEISFQPIRWLHFGSAAAGAVILTAFWSQFITPFLGYEYNKPYSFIDTPILNDALVLCYFSVVALIGSLMYYPGLRSVGGNAKYSETFGVLLHIAIVYTPIIWIGADLLAFTFGISYDPDTWSRNDYYTAKWSMLVLQFIPFVNAVFVLAPLHGLSAIRTFGAALLSGFVGVVVVIAIAFALSFLGVSLDLL